MSLLSRLNPANLIPRFPPYLGPYAVGSFEVEIPVASLAPPGSIEGIAETVQFRVFYPTQKPAENLTPAQAGGWWGKGDKKQDAPQEEDLSGVPNTNSKPVRWLPEPHQREYLSAYARFLGASSGFAEIVSHISRLLHYISLPAIADAPLLPSEHRFPTMIFSHGLGGTRLAYSHICGSIASYGVVVVAPEHRDGSAPVSFVKTPASNKPGTQESQISGPKPSGGEPGIGETSASSEPPKKDGNGRAQVDYLTYPHHVTDETANGRNRQLEIRFREIGLIYSALAKLDLGQIPTDTMVSTDDTVNGAEGAGKKLLSQLKNHLDIHTPGRVIWAGHSFGASTMFQFIKSVYYTTPPEFTSNDDFKPLLTPSTFPSDGILPLHKQVIPSSPLMLLDLWCLPLLGKRTSHLFKQPLPQISHHNGRSVLIVMSEEFWKWKENLGGVRRVLSSDPGRKRGGSAQKWFEQWDDEHERILAHANIPGRDPVPDTPAPMASVEDSRLETGDQIVPPDGTTPVPTRPTSSAGAEDPRFFYSLRSAHLSQSDFGILFPRAIRKAENPQRVLELNVRAAAQWLREAGYVLGRDGGEEGIEGGMERLTVGEEGDRLIFEGEVEGWSRIGLEEVEESAKEAS